MSDKLVIKRFVLAEFLPDVPESELADDLDLIDSGVIDSLSLLKLLAWLEDRFELPIDDIELDPDSLRTVTAITEFVDRARSAGAVAK
ncbi:phosphopantetheine-binding protein [Actinokineospora sp. HUAS TT18]|uniref:phosphopantetheine-binding protein n=1 Tax=Actinokineospora sp. HUAS TT18 TaxID=3447451 RepID=UPI003F51D844